MTQANRTAWEAASQKYVREYGDLLAQAISGSSLVETERDLPGVACRYVAAAVPEVPLASASADLVYTGKGALVWMADLAGWAREVARLLRPWAAGMEIRHLSEYPEPFWRAGGVAAASRLGARAQRGTQLHRG